MTIPQRDEGVGTRLRYTARAYCRGPQGILRDRLPDYFFNGGTEASEARHWASELVKARLSSGSVRHRRIAARRRRPGVLRAAGQRSPSTRGRPLTHR